MYIRERQLHRRGDRPLRTFDLCTWAKQTRRFNYYYMRARRVTHRRVYNYYADSFFSSFFALPLRKDGDVRS
jgi:hypothetical protein